ncbi:WWE domain-containing protein [Durusdinium trenchii]|uniref:WWE domain-containing protein n=1 Tax=Durusdinium trenchii TaxID=1381693 RepID=A0ABP0RTV9_9DINO
MSCPYCLAFAPPTAPGVKSNGVAQQRQLEQNKTLVKAYWEFEEGQNHWLGFSPKVSVLLEAAYQNWLQHPSEVRSQIHANGFLYNVDYTTLLEEGQRQSQRIRRVGATLSALAYCTVDPALWQEMQIKLQSFREEQEWLLRLLRSDQHGATEKADVKSDGFYGVSRLWQRVGRQAEELEVLRSQVERSRQLLERLRCLEGIRPTGSDMEQFESLDLD